jgi:hypothetical protein
MPASDSWTAAASLANELEVLLAKGALENAGIPCRTQLKTPKGPTELMVKPADAAKAKEILEESKGGGLF